MRFSLSLTFLLLLILPLHSQESNVKKGDELFESLAYATAIKQYQKAYDKGDTGNYVCQRLGDCYYYISDYTNAYVWYSKVFSKTPKDLPAAYYYRYASTLKSKGKTTEAINILSQYFEIRDEGISSDYKRDSIWSQTSLYDLKNLNINSSYSDFSPSINKNQLVFASSKDTGTYRKIRHKWTDSPFLDLYMVPKPENDALFNPDEIKSFSKEINSILHESSSVFTKDGKTVYFTRNNIIENKRKRDKEGYTRLKIFKADLVDGEWTNIKELPFNGENFSCAHPSLNKEETQLFFSSDMPGSYGESDIYMVDILEDGFGEPKNIGPKVNTKFRETYPFITESNNLYFVSDGYSGFGGLDIYITNISEGVIGEVYNLGEPINSPFDDFSLIVDSDEQMGYFASNRAGGKGNDDIYKFKIKSVEQVEKPVDEIIIVEEVETLANPGALYFEPIYFDFDKADIKEVAALNLKQIVKVMNQLPNASINISAHTDYRGTEGYNQVLSEERASNTKKYLVTSGININRITTGAYGESQLLVLCDQCSETEHRLNRRAEFKFSLPEGNIYLVQIGAFVSELDFEKLNHIPELIYYTFDDGFTRLFSGVFHDLESAEARKTELEEIGVEAFIRKLE